MSTIQIKVPNWLDFLFAWPVLFYRERKFGQPYRKIRLTEGKFTLVDQNDFYWLNNFDWFTKKNNKSFYAVRFDNDCAKWPTLVSMHRQIMDSPVGLLVDHRNLDGLDNRRDNLRIATYSENNCNRLKKKNTSSRFVGVCWEKTKNRWVVHIRHNGKIIYLGLFKSETDAAHAYDAAARKYHGEFAHLNFSD